MEDGEAEFEEVPQEEEEEEVVVDDGEDDDGGEGYRTESTEKKSKVTCDWSQFSMPQMNYPQQGEPLRLQVIDIEHQKRRLPRWDMDDSEVERVREAARIYGPKWKQNKPFYPTVPCIRLYCKDTRGYSYCVNAYGYYPVVHLLASIAVTDAVLTELRDYVEEQLTENESKGPFPKKRPDGWQAILTARVVEGFPAFPFSENPHTFLEFRLSDSCYVKAFGRLMRQNGGELESPSLGDVKVMPYSCQDIVDKFQADIRVSGFGWLLLDRFIRTGDAVGADDSSCDFELDTCVSWLRNVKGCDDIAPLRKITYDIECLKTEGMPDPDKDAVIVISAICGDYVNGQPAKKRKVLLQLNKADPVKNIVPENGDVHHCFDSEVDLLDAFGELVLAYDPDYICGHNMIGFDLPYLVTRADKVNADSLRYMGRRRAYKWSKPRKVVKKRKSGETRETKMTSTPGRIQLDTLNWIMGGFEKERSYKLGALAAKYLGDTKDDVGYSMIGPMFRQSDATRARLSKYCLKDSELTEGLCDLNRYQMVISTIEMSRQTRVPAGKLLRSGVQVKVWGLLLEKANDPHFDDRGTRVFFPDEEVRERGKDEKFPGAEVLEPCRGFYKKWVGCGDFRSLYPSIIIDLNICYTTEIRGDKYDDFPFKKSPIGVKFIDKKKRIGLLAQIEVELMGNRTVARGQAGAAKKAGDMGAFNMFDKRQNEIKIICNSVYGIMTASGGRLTRMELGESVTSQGRLMIMTAKSISEGLLISMGHEKAGVDDFKVIYGDTDSIFILFPDWIVTKEDAFGWLKIICDAVTEHFVSLEPGSPIMLQAEKAMRGGILINKKRYIFMKYEGVDDKGKILAKGVETARRDNCQMVVECMNNVMAKLFPSDGKVDKDGALQVIWDVLRDLMAGKTDIGKLVITKAISKSNYKNDPPHLVVARKMQARDPSYEAGPAERIPFVIVSNGGKSVTERAEDPLWAIKQQIPIDLDYYIMNQLAGPVARILMWMHASPQDLHTMHACEQHFRDTQEKLAGDFTRISTAHKELVKSIKTMQEHTIQQLFGPNSLSKFPRKIQSTAGKRGSIDSFFTTKKKQNKRCIHGNDPPACAKCLNHCEKCGNELGEEDGICPKCNPACIRCQRPVERVVDGNICIPCAEHRCRACSEPLDPDQKDGCLCKGCDARFQVRKRHRITLATTTTPDIEDLVKQAAEAKLKCDKCRGYADETEIRCVQKDCNNLYRRATLETRMKNLIH